VRSALGLVAGPGVDEQQVWLAQAERDARAFLMKHGHLLSDPSLVHWVVEQCAELVWEWHRSRPSWTVLQVADVWAQLERLHDFFPLPRLVVAYYETLAAFLPWLAARAQIERAECAHQLAELERVCSPTLSEARRLLASRR
jgi:hypothetical protein